jgi:hypothetical protein
MGFGATLKQGGFNKVPVEIAGDAEYAVSIFKNEITGGVLGQVGYGLLNVFYGNSLDSMKGKQI